MKQKYVSAIMIILTMLCYGCMVSYAAEDESSKVIFTTEFQDELSKSNIPGIELYAEIVDLSLLTDVEEIPEDFKMSYNKVNENNTDVLVENELSQEEDIGDNNGYSLYLTDVNNWETSLSANQPQIISIRASLINSFSDEFSFELSGDCITVDLTGKDPNNIYTGKYTFVKLEPNNEKNVIVNITTNSNSVIPNVNVAEVDQLDKEIVSGIKSGELSYHETETESSEELEYNYEAIKEALKDRDKQNEIIHTKERKKITIIVLCTIGGLILCGGFICYRKIKKFREDD